MPLPSGPSSESWSCDVARELLPRRLDGDLGVTVASALERHLESCPSCREEAAGLERAAEALRQLSPDERARLRERTYRELGLEDPGFPGEFHRGSLRSPASLREFHRGSLRSPASLREFRSRSRLRRLVFFLVMGALVYAWVRTRPLATAPLDRGSQSIDPRVDTR